METLLHWIYVVLAAGIVVLLLRELFTEERWKQQIAVVIVLIPLILRILHIK